MLLAEVLKFAPFQSPARYVFVDPDSGHPYVANDMPSLHKQIVSYREQNRLPAISHLDLVVEHYLCLLPENAGKCSRTRLRRGLIKYVKGGVALLEQVFLRHQVEPEEADRRASICAKCPYNVFPDKTAFVQWSDEFAEAAVGRVTNFHDKLGNCEICSCTLKVKVWYKGAFDLTPEETQKLPDFCWQKTLYPQPEDAETPRFTADPPRKTASKS